ncbi:MAG TPA: homoserine kinase [Anaerolineales bacterium]|nr:homoserine kinase [Anaerolineales bacterium]
MLTLSTRTTIRVPATTANLGPGFDCLGLALDLHNEFAFEILSENEGQFVESEGFGAGVLPADRTNLVVRAFNAVFERLEAPAPGLRLRARNRFPIGSGLGSSGSAIAAGVLAALRFAGAGPDRLDPVAIAVEIEGHPDNVSAAFLGGLTVSIVAGGRTRSVKAPVAPGWRVGVVVPEIEITTAAMRAALPDRVAFTDAVFNLGRTALVTLAFSKGETGLLRDAMEDRLHQPVRLPLIPGAVEALDAARGTGAAASLSGAGPGLIAFSTDEDAVREAVRKMEAVFAGRSMKSWMWVGNISERGCEEVTVTGGSESHRGGDSHLGE